MRTSFDFHVSIVDGSPVRHSLRMGLQFYGALLLSEVVKVCR